MRVLIWRQCWNWPAKSWTLRSIIGVPSRCAPTLSMLTSILLPCFKIWIACLKRSLMRNARSRCVRTVPARVTIWAIFYGPWAGVTMRSHNTRPLSGSIRTLSWRITIVAWRCAARQRLRKRGDISRARLRSSRIFWKPNWPCAWLSFRRFTKTHQKSSNGATPMRAGWPACARM